MRTLNELFTVQTSLIDLILFCNFLLKFSNKSPSRIKPGRTLWCPKFKRLLWSPTPLSSCISVHLKETRNSPDLLVCFSFGQPSNRGNYSDSSCLLISFCQIQEVWQVQASAAGVWSRTEGSGAARAGQGGKPRQEPATGWGSDWLWAALSSSFASSGVVS